MTRVLLALCVSLGLLVLAPGPSWACSCAVMRTPEQVRNAGTIAAGTVDWTATDGQTRTYSVRVDSVYKGSAARSEKLVTSADEASCGVTDLATSRRYLFFIEGRHPGSMQVGLCGGTTAYDDALAQRVEALTGPPSEPLPGTPLSPPGDERSRTTTIALGAAGLLAALAAAAVVLRRRAG